jgi:poly-gamma-glutamate capsule biosynthesis protein CapA/YwtB (metallophosphatase superfamily)
MIKIGFVGDFCPIGRTEHINSTELMVNAFSQVLPLFESNDFNIINLECPLTKVDNKIIKTGPHLKANPTGVNILNYFDCKLVTTANNHFMDFGIEGLNETYSILKENQIEWIGSGANINEASNFIIKIIKGLKVAFFNMTETEWTTTSGMQPGCNPLDLPKAIRTIQMAKAAGADKIIAILHGGHEHYPYPSPRMKSQYRFMIDAGADAVVSNHSHIVSGFEVYKECPIFYGLGNFIFDWPETINKPWNIGMFLNLIIEKNEPIKFNYTFFRQNDAELGVFPLNNIESKAIEEKLSEINGVINNDIKLEEAFNFYSLEQEAIMLQRLQPYKNRLFAALYRKGILPDLMGRSKRRMIKAIIQCEAHRDVLLNILKGHI